MNDSLRVEKLPVPDRSGVLGSVFEAAILENASNAIPALRRYSAYAVVLVLHVEGEAFYEDETGVGVALAPGDCVFVNPRVAHRYGPREGSRWSELYLSYRGPLFDALHALSPGAPVRRVGDLDATRRTLLAVLTGGGAAGTPDACVGRLIAWLSSVIPSVADVGDAPWIARIKRLLDIERLSVAEATRLVASAEGLSPETLRKKFKVEVGCSLKTWQMEARLRTARSLMSRGGMTQKDIATTLGFAHPQHFSRALRKARRPGAARG